LGISTFIPLIGIKSITVVQRATFGTFSIIPLVVESAVGITVRLTLD